MGCGSSSSATGTAPEGTAAEAPANGNNHKSSGISGRGHGPHAPKAKQMSRAHFESKIGTVGFDKADDDKSGKLSDKEWAELFESIDTDHDGVVDQQEWEAAFGAGTFESWDENADKALDKDEWKKIFDAAVARGTIKKDHSNRSGISG